jgi:small-conductance mechanosensitive channel
MRKFYLILMMVCFLFGLHAQEAEGEVVYTPYPVVIENDTLLYYYCGLGSFSAEERANYTTDKINSLFITQHFRDSVYVKTSDYYSEIFVGERSVITLTNDDAVLYKTSLDSLTTLFVGKLEGILQQQHEAITGYQLIKDIIAAILILLVAFGLNYIILRFSYRLEAWLYTLKEKEDYFIKILPKVRLNTKKILSIFLYFYDGLKLILIIYIIVKSVSFLLKLTNLHLYWDFVPLFNGIFKAITLTILSWYTYLLLRVLVTKCYHKFNEMKPKILEKMHYKSFTFMTEDKLLDIGKFTIKILYFASILLLLYFYITLLFSFFSFTKSWAGTLFHYILAPLEHSVMAIVNYLPNVFAILVIFFIFKYAIKFIKMLFDAVENEIITIPGFYKDWATPTFKIVRFLVIVFGMIVVFPYLPGSDSPFFQGITVFLGVLISFGSSSAIANIVAGVVLTYMRPFRVGDIVKIADTQGRVTEKTLLVTRIRTIKNLEITVPNATVLSSHITNFSANTQEAGLILHTTVTMGYDTPWQQVHELLIKSALQTDLVLHDPSPFVLQKSLDDYYVSYELNVYTRHSNRMPFIFSDLHQHIQDAFNEAGLELMSTAFTAIRDGNQKCVPENYIPEGYEKPGFKLDPVTNFFAKK